MSDYSEHHAPPTPHHEKLVWIGAGGVATNLALALRAVGFATVQVVARGQASAQELAAQLGPDVWAHALDDLFTPGHPGLHPDATLILLAVPDAAVEPVAARLAPLVQNPNARPGLMVAHTAGSVPLVVLAPHTAHGMCGVFYPLQTLSKQRPLPAHKLREIPILYEGARPNPIRRLERMAHAVSQTVLQADSNQRFGLHIGAVVASNFVNELMRTAGEIAARVPNSETIGPRLYLPLVREVLDKLEALGPEAAQTGPARRGDLVTLRRHAQTLDAWGDADTARLYRLVSERILRRYHPALPQVEW